MAQYGGRGNPDYLNQFLFYANNLARAEFGVPGSMFRLGPNNQLYLTPQFMGMFGYRLSLSLVEAVTRGAGKAAAYGLDDVALFAEGIKEASKSDRNRIKTANQRLAGSMRTAVVTAYTTTVERHKRVPSYRVGRNRFAGGALRRALQASDMVVGTDQGIKYINQARLNLEARHWARLNFGVQPAETPAAYKGTLRFGGQTLGAIGFRAQPRPPMFLPAGFWRSPGGGSERRQQGQRGWRATHAGGGGFRSSRQEFYPLSGAPRYPTRGVVGANYLDAGIRTLEAKFGEEYSGIVDDWIKAAAYKRKSKAGTAILKYVLDINLNQPFNPKFIER